MSKKHVAKQLAADHRRTRQKAPGQIPSAKSQAAQEAAWLARPQIPGKQAAQAQTTDRIFKNENS
jgi:aminoglycoside phosphotransferase